MSRLEYMLIRTSTVQQIIRDCWGLSRILRHEVKDSVDLPLGSQSDPLEGRYLVYN